MQKLPACLREDFVLIKSPFVETTRKGEHLFSVIIALTPSTLIITWPQDEKTNQLTQSKESHHSLETTKLAVFKKSQRQSIKVSFDEVATKYFELGQSNKRKKKYLRWTNKHLYLGPKRAAEDNDRPKPVPGLGRTEDIKLLYLKPKYFGCWDQSEHWVQCGNSSSSFNN